MKPDTHEELLTLYNHAVDSIRSFQDRQAAVTSYTALAFAGLIGYTSASKPTSNIIAMLTWAATGAALWGVIWLVSLQNAMTRARDLVKEVRTTFTEDTQQVLIKVKYNEGRKLNLLYLFIPVVAVGWVLTNHFTRQDFVMGQLRKRGGSGAEQRSCDDRCRNPQQPFSSYWPV